MKKITLFLMNKKGLECLRTIIQTFGAESIEQIYTHDDTSVENDYSKEICDLCNKEKIEWTTEWGEGGGNGQYWREEGIKTDFVIAIGWRWLIDTDKTVLVLHDSLLPKYKGWNPLVTALINGDTKTGVSAFIANNGADMGEVILKEEVWLTYPIKIEQAIEQLIPSYQAICCQIMELLNSEKTKFRSMDSNGEEASYSMWRDEEDYRINWNWSADKIVRFVDAVGSPYQGSVTATNYLKDGVITVNDCEIYFPDAEVADRERHIGKVIFKDNGKYVVIAGEGLVKINDMTVLSTRDHIDWKGKFRVRFK